MFQAVNLAVTLLLSVTLCELLLLFQNVNRARRTGLPYIIVPFHEAQTLAYVTDPLLRWLYAGYLMRGNGWPRWARFMVKDWMWEDKARAHQEYGENFLVVSSRGLVCYIGNAEAASAIASRRKDFIKPPKRMRIFEPFGPNVVSTDGDLWKLHVKITAAPFNDSINQLVYVETTRQVDFLIAARRHPVSRSWKRDIYSLTMNVMSYAGFGKKITRIDDQDLDMSSRRLSLPMAMLEVVTHLPHVVLVPRSILKISPWRSAYWAFKNLEEYINNYKQEEKQRLAHAQDGTEKINNNLLTALIQSNKNTESNNTWENNTRGNSQRATLTDSEISGNIFVFLLAGYDTTANTILYASLVLAINHEIQDRVANEIARVFSDAKQQGRTELSYEEDLPKLRYTAAFMFEILRVFPIVLPIVRMVTSQMELSTNPKETKFMIPPGSHVVVNNTALHYNEDYWPRPHTIEPQRWLAPSPNSYDPHHPTAAEKQYIKDGKGSTSRHRRGTFMTFNEGPRACLGKRFARTEFIAFFARLLRHNRLRLGEDISKEQVDKILRLRSQGSPVTLVPPEDIDIRVVPACYGFSS